MPTIKIPLDIGDKVWFIADNMLLRGTITAFYYRRYPRASHLTYTIQYKKSSPEDIRAIDLDTSKVFRSKGALCKSVSYED